MRLFADSDFDINMENLNLQMHFSLDANSVNK